MKKYRLFIIIIIIIAVCLFFSPFKPVKNLFFQIFSPVTTTLNSVASNVRNFFGDIASIKNLSRENKTLKEENNSLTAQIAALNELKIENEALKKEIGFKQEAKQNNLIMAKIVSKSVTPYMQSFLIDKGEKDNVKKGQIVLSQGHLVGVISETYKDYADVELITNSKSLIPVILQTSRSMGLLKSNLEGLYIDNIPIDEEIKIDEVVLTSNLDKNIPSDIVIGKVSKITTYQSQIFQTIKITSPIEFSKLEFVFIVEDQ